MDQQHQFLRLLQEVKRKLWLHKAVHTLLVTLFVCVGITLLWIVSSRFFIIPFLERKIAITIGLVMIGFVVSLFWRRPSNLEAIKKMDQQNLHDRVMTTYSFLKEESDIAKLQRKDTLNKMRKILPTIKEEKVQWFKWKQAAFLSCMVLLAFLASMFPNDVRETAKNMEEEIEIVEENKEKVEQFAEKHKENAGKEADEELDELLEEVKKANNADEISKDIMKAENQLNELKEQSNKSERQLNKLAEQLNSQGLGNLAEAASQMNTNEIENEMANLREQMNDFSEEELQALQEKLQSQAESLAMDEASQNEEKLSKEELEELMNKLESELKDLAKSAEKASNLALAQEEIQQLAENINQQMMTAGLNTPSSGSLSSGTSPSSNTSGAGEQPAGEAQQGESNTESGSGSKASSTSGNGSGSGSGSGAGNGSVSGSGSGSGSGNSSGAGNGAGLGAGNHELAVPQQLEGKENQEVDSGELGGGQSEKQIAPNAPILPGEVRSYGEVFEHYENTYRQAIERNDYPEHLQEMIKAYFSDIEPGEGN